MRGNSRQSRTCAQRHPDFKGMSFGSTMGPTSPMCRSSTDRPTHTSSLSMHMPFICDVSRTIRGNAHVCNIAKIVSTRLFRVSHWTAGHALRGGVRSVRRVGVSRRRYAYVPDPWHPDHCATRPGLTETCNQLLAKRRKRSGAGRLKPPPAAQSQYETQSGLRSPARHRRGSSGSDASGRLPAPD